MLQDLIPITLEETILSYLKGQEQFGEDFDLGHLIAERDVKFILEDLLLKVSKRIACKDRYENLKLWHHQYPLFDMTTFISNYCMDDEMFKKLAFRETLLISELDYPSESMETVPRAVGGLCIDVQAVDAYQPCEREEPTDAELDRQVFQILQRIKGVRRLSTPLNEKDLENEIQQKLLEYENFLKNEMANNVRKFIVHLSSQFQVGECNAGSTITSWVDRHLHTLEEKRTEYIVEPTGVNEQTIYASMQNRKYYMRHTNNLEDEDVRKYYPFTITKNLVLEGASFILMRYLAVTQFVGTFEMSTMYINGDMCRNIYECVGPKPGTVNGKNIPVCKIYRYIIEECGIEHVGVTVLTTYGRIITQEWEGCSYIMNMNPLKYIDKNPPPGYERMVLKEIWKEDLQLMSHYLDCQTAAEREMKTYMVDYPEVKEMISDYVQNVLLLKPENILAFTKNYFENLYPFESPRIAYVEGKKKETEEVHF